MAIFVPWDITGKSTLLIFFTGDCNPQVRVFVPQLLQKIYNGIVAFFDINT